MNRIALALLVLATTAGAAAYAAQAGGSSPMSLVLVAHARATSMRLAHPKRPSLGDGFVERGVLTTTGGRPWGTYGGQGTLLSLAGKGSELSFFGFALPNGTITAAGQHASSDRYSMAIVGGTGAYVGARGTASFSPAPHDAVRVSVSLLP
jgi:allene oxide cyclase-like protein